MSIVPPIPPTYANQSTSQYVKKKDVKRTRKRAAYDSRRTMKANPRYTRAGVQKMPAPKIALKVSNCSMRYMAALCNPFQAEPGACVPCDLFPLPSQKIRAFTRGSFACGVGGVGFILAAPCAANDAPAIAYTQAASPMTVNDPVNAGITGGGTQFLAGLPYNIVQVNGAVQARVVSMGIRIRYAGTEAGRSGTIACYEDQDHIGQGTPGGALTNFNSVQLNTSATVSRPSGDGGWDACVCSSGPVTPVELEFVARTYPHSVTQTLNAAGYLLIMVNGIVGDKYDFECFQHIEYIGTNVAAKTPSHADTDQYGKIIQSAKEIANVRPLTPASGPSLWDRFSAKVSEALPQLVNFGVGALRAYEGDAGGYAQLLGGAASFITEGPKKQPSLRRGQTERMAYIEA